jgi:hypothetical protein
MNGCPRNSHRQSNRYLPRFLGAKHNGNYRKPASDKGATGAGRDWQLSGNQLKTSTDRLWPGGDCGASTDRQ